MFQRRRFNVQEAGDSIRMLQTGMSLEIERMKRALRYRTDNSTKLNRFNSAVAFNGDFHRIRQGQTDKRFLINLAELSSMKLT